MLDLTDAAPLVVLPDLNEDAANQDALKKECMKQCPIAVDLTMVAMLSSQIFYVAYLVLLRTMILSFHAVKLDWLAVKQVISLIYGKHHTIVSIDFLSS